MSTLLAIDPGDKDSAYALIDVETRRPLEVDKIGNDRLLELLRRLVRSVDAPERLAIEMIASYGMPVGREVFETCVWIGRYMETSMYDVSTSLVYRRDVKLHHCQSSKAKDANITAALIDRFAPGLSNRGKGTKANPGWFYGFADDIWQAYALAVQQADEIKGYQP